MFAAGLLLLTSQVPPDSAAEQARAALIATKAEMQQVDACRAGARRQALLTRYESLRAEATGLLPLIDPAVGDVLAGARCRRTTMARAAAALDQLAAAVARRRAAMRGLWFGPRRLCAGTVIAIEDSIEATDQRTILIRFSPAMREAVALETTQRLDSQLPLVLDGRTVSNPVVREPILGGVISIVGGDPAAEIEGGTGTLRAAAALPCGD